MSEEQAIRDAVEAWSERGVDGLLDLVKRIWVFVDREPAARQAGLEA